MESKYNITLAVIAITLLISSLALPISQTSAEKSSGVHTLTHNDILYEIPYTITDAKIRSISLEGDFETILISLFENNRDGSLEITLPRELVVNCKIGEIEPIVAIDGKETKLDVLYKDDDAITIKFDLPAQSKNIRIIKTILLSTSSLSLDLHPYWINRGETLGVNATFYDCEIDAEFVEFEIKINGPLPKHNEIFSKTIFVENGGKTPLQIKIPRNIEAGRYNITIFPVDTVTKQYSSNIFTVRGPAFMPVNIQYVGPGSTEREQFIFTDTSSVMFVDTNSSRYGWYALAEEKAIRFYVSGKEETMGYMILVIPRNIIDNIKDVRIVAKNSTYSIEANSTHTKIAMQYSHAGEYNEIPIIITASMMIPEFPANLMIITAIGLIVTLIASRFRGRILPKKL